jgi:hypothetical protein
MQGIEACGVDILGEARRCGKATCSEQNRAEFNHDFLKTAQGRAFPLIFAREKIAPI